MSHHSSELSEAMRALMGEYPNGRLSKDDAGAIAVSIGEESGRVVMRFPKPVAWIGFTGDEAMEIAQTLMKHARAAGLTKPVTIRI
jgi:hypothetical protein